MIKKTSLLQGGTQDGAKILRHVCFGINFPHGQAKYNNWKVAEAHLRILCLHLHRVLDLSNTIRKHAFLELDIVLRIYLSPMSGVLNVRWYLGRREAEIMAAE